MKTDELRHELEQLVPTRSVLDRATAERVRARATHRSKVKRITVGLALTAVLLAGGLVAWASARDPGTTSLDVVGDAARQDGSDLAGVTAQHRCEAPEPRPEVITEEQRRQVREALAESQRILEATGWQRVTGESLLEDGVWVCGWVQPADVSFEAIHERLDQGLDLAGGPTVVHDAPNGTIIGYGIGTAGFLPVDAPASFDLEAAIVRRNGCPELLRADC